MSELFDCVPMYGYKVNLYNGEIIYDHPADIIQNLMQEEPIEKEVKSYMKNELNVKKGLSEINDMILPKTSRTLGGKLFSVKSKFRSKYA